MAQGMLLWHTKIITFTAHLSTVAKHVHPFMATICFNLLATFSSGRMENEQYESVPKIIFAAIA